MIYDPLAKRVLFASLARLIAVFDVEISDLKSKEDVAEVSLYDEDTEYSLNLRVTTKHVLSVSVGDLHLDLPKSSVREAAEATITLFVLAVRAHKPEPNPFDV